MTSSGEPANGSAASIGCSDPTRRPVYCVHRTVLGFYLITHPDHPGLAWSGFGWVQHCDGLPARDYRPLWFDSEDDADDYATEYALYPRRD